jgi:nitrogen regulatory protein P-II 1
VKLITAIIRPERLPEVKAALFRVGVTGVTLSRVAGHGGEREVIQRYRAETVVLEFHDKVRLEMACSEPFVEPCVQAILSAARTGEVGDGKIFVQPLEQVIRIRTGERDGAALTPVTADAVQRRARGAAVSGAGGDDR